MAKFHKVGTVFNGKKGLVARMGNPDAKSEKFKYNIKLQLEDANGKVLQVNPTVLIRDPREGNKNASKIPDSIVYELTMIVDDDS